MDPIEINTEGYDLSSLRERRTPTPTPYRQRSVTGDPQLQTSAEPAAPTGDEAAPQPAAATRTRKKKDDEITVDLEKHKTVVGLTRFFAGDSLRYFIGIVLILISGYMIVSSISYISTFEADQSIIRNSTTAEIAANPQPAANEAGWFGALLSHLIIYRWLGLGGFVVIFYVAALGLGLFRLFKLHFWELTFKSLVAAIAVSVITGFITYDTVSPTFWGGEHGYYINQIVISSASVWGGICLSIMMAAALVLIFTKPIKRLISKIVGAWKRYKNAMATRYRESMDAARVALDKERSKPGQQPQPENDADASNAATQTEPEKSDDSNVSPYQFELGIKDEEPEIELQPEAVNPPATTTIENPSDGEMIEIKMNEAEEEEETLVDIEAFDPTAELSRYRFPTIDLLHERQSTYTLSEEEQEENNRRIVNTLATYGIGIKKIMATVGPTITLYEIIPADGVRIATIRRLGDDMTMSLAATGIRIIAPMPGKGTIGMEVPNKKPQVVGIRSILSSRAYHESTADLPLAMGKTIDNEVFVADLAKMPHLLVAGATGMGKSVGLNTIIASLLYKKHPAELKFVLVDPKMVEFSLYKTIERHYLAKLPTEDEDTLTGEESSAVITDSTKVVATLNSLCVEMENRYRLLSTAKMRGIKDYNKKFISRQLNPEKGHRYLPYIVVIIDEFADLITTAGKEVETPIQRIAAKARAVGIHMILATQRPSVNVITGLIKANFPGRMAFRVTQMNDSRTILDRPGADQLIGKGDMLISRDGMIDRVQCAFIDTDEVEAICDYISSQMGYPTAYLLPESLPAGAEGGAMSGNLGDRDPMFAEAGREVIASNMGSASLLQRKFNIGYPRAGKLIDQLEAAGVVGKSTGAGKPRPVLMDMYSFERLVNGE